MAEFEEIKGPELSSDTTVPELVKSMKTMGFQATNVAKAADLIRRMKSEKATLFLTFTSNMVSSGLREIFAQLAKNKAVDVIITSVGSVEEDLMKCRKPFLLGDFNADDKELHERGINRIGNVFVPNDRYEEFEKTMIPFFEKIYKKQKETGKMISPQELAFELGKIADESSFLYWAMKNNIPIFCPGIMDGALGLQVYFFKQRFPDFGIDVTADMKKLADITLNAEKTGGIILGGGAPKHYALGVNILRDGFDYTVYISTGTEFDGSLSGARPHEAKSWGKLKEDATFVHVEADATIVFPLVARALL